MPKHSIQLFIAVVAVLTATGVRDTIAADWPTLRHDNRRSGATSETIYVSEIREAWTFRPTYPPQPAWGGPADVDAYRKVKRLGDMRGYDLAFDPIVAQARVYFASSADDAVYCLNGQTGEVLWRFTTEGPIRVAPSYDAGCIYVGSDDGRAYCLDAENGELVWQFAPPVKRRLVVHDGRLISMWPCRTGVLVDHGTAYFAMSMLPWRPTFLCAVDAQTGKPVGAGRYVKELDEGNSLEAALLASTTRVIAPQGRIGPAMFDRVNGKPIGSLPGASTFALLTEDDGFYSGPSSRDIGVRGTNSSSNEQIAWHPQAIAMAATSTTSYLLSPAHVSAIDNQKKTTLWTSEVKDAVSLALAGDVLLVGATNQVVALETGEGQPVWQAPVNGRAFGLAVSDGAVVVGTDTGQIRCFRADGNADQQSAKNENSPLAQPEPVESNASPGAATAQVPATVKVTVQPYIQFTSARECIVRWETDTPTATIVTYGVADKEHRYTDKELTTQHAAKFVDLAKNQQVRYQVIMEVDGRQSAGPAGSIDTFFNYEPPLLPEWKELEENDAADLASRVLNETGVSSGVCFVYGVREPHLAYELARSSRLRVTAMETEPEAARRLRDKWQAAGIYGPRLNVLSAEAAKGDVIPEMVANLIVCDMGASASSEDVEQVASLVHLLRPEGGTIYVNLPSSSDERGDLEELLKHLLPSFEIERGPSGYGTIVRRGKLPGAGDWSHQYGGGNNAGYAGETLQGARAATDMRAQWMGRPGPRYHADRQVRKPAPLVTAGRMFVQGQSRMIALDAYNGAPLWSLELPTLQRYDIPHDASNWSADVEQVFVAMEDQLWQISAVDGQVVRRISVVPGRRDDVEYDWGYVGNEGSHIVGSANTRGANFTGWWGGRFWYDDENNSLAASDNLFAVDKSSGEPQWTYTGGIILNPSITLADGRVYFVESRDPTVQQHYAGRVSMGGVWPQQFLVALDLETGDVMWEQELTITGGQSAFYVAHSEGKLALLASASGQFHLHTFDAATGTPRWNEKFDWGSRGHGGHYSRPVIVEGKVFVRPAVFDMETGERLPLTIPGGGCGTYCATRDALFFRSGDISAWAPETEQLSGWSRLRPGCWLNTIPAGGLLLSPEAGGGCSCGVWMETSMAFAPRTYAPPTWKDRNRNFVDSMQVELFNYSANGVTRYTLDGSQPTGTSAKYEGPIPIDQDTEVRAATFWESDGGELVSSDTVKAKYYRSRPTPSFVGDIVTFTETLEVELARNGDTGTIHYTLDGTDPSPTSAIYDGPVSLSDSADFVARTFWTNTEEPVGSAVVRQFFKRVHRQLPTEAKINFQHPGNESVPGYLPAGGETFRIQPSGYYYGWTRDMWSRMRSRGDEKDPLRRTFVKCMDDTAWEIEVENGTYDVTVCIGEIFYGTERGTIYVEDVEFCKDVQLDRGVTREYNAMVKVEDGRLSITSHEDNAVQCATRLNYLHLRKVEAGESP